MIKIHIKNHISIVKTNVIFMFLILFFCLFNFDVYAVDTSMICSTSSSGEVTLIKYASSEPNVIIPNTFNGNPITKIASNAFSDNAENLESIVFPKYLKVIDTFAFSDCVNLHTIKLNENLESIGNYAFYDCSGLENVYIDSFEHLWSISFGSYANPINYAENIYIDNVLISEEITLPDDITSIPDNAFAGWKNITKITMPENVTEIGAKAFNQCSNLTEIIWNDKILNIHDYAFNGCKQLTSFILPDSVQYIGNQAFNDCDNMRGIILGTSIKTIGNNVFDKYSLIGISYKGSEEQWNDISIGTLSADIPIYFNVVDGVIAEGTCGDTTTWELDYKGSLVVGGTGDMEDYRYSSDVVWKDYEDSILSVTISEGVTSIGNYAFYSTSVSDLTISNTVTRIGDYAFWCCFDLADVFIPENVEEIGDYALWATNIKTIDVDKDNKFYTSKDDVLYNKDMTLLIQYAPEKENSAFRIPDTVTEIGTRAFASADNLRSLSFGTNVTTIGLQALYDLKNLSYIFFDGSSEEWQYSLPYQVYYKLVTNSEYVDDSYLTYAIFDNTAIVIAASNPPENVVVPSLVNECPVIAISGNVFANTNIKTISLPNTLQKIEAKAFYQCRELEEITMSDSLSSIGEDAFYYCNKLTNIYLPKTLSKIGSDAFRYCSSLENVYLTDIPSWWEINFGNEYSNPMYYADLVYLNGNLLEEYVMPDDVTEIPENAFKGWKFLKSVTISKNVTVIPNSAFKDCTNLHAIVLHSAITDIKEQAFYNCTNLMYAEVPSSVNSIASNAFYNCKKLTTVTIPNGRTEIVYSEFKDFSNLKYIVLPDSVTSIGDYAFQNCVNLEEINISNNISNLGWGAFKGCTNLKNITIPNDITFISGELFYGCSNLEKVIFHDEIKIIYESAFNGCSKLKDIDMPKAIENIGTYAFKDCKTLENIVIPENLISIEKGAFYGCSGVETIYYNARKINELKYNDNVFFYTGKKVVFGSTVEEIPNYIFSGSGITIEQIEISEGVTRMGMDTFRDNSKLKSVVIGEGLLNIGSCAFADCKNLENIIIPESVKVIEGMAFYNCSRLKNFALPEGLTEIGTCAFQNCYSITKIQIPGNVNFVSHWAFWNCTGLENIVIEEGVSSIGEGAFCLCSNLKNIILPRSLTFINAAAFANCGNLQMVYYGGTMDEWKNIQLNRLDNECLVNSAKEYNLKAFTKTIVTYLGGKSMFSISGFGIRIGEYIILALYNNDEFVHMQREIYTGDDVCFTTAEVYNSAKVMVWESFTNLKPVCNVEIVK